MVVPLLPLGAAWAAARALPRPSRRRAGPYHHPSTARPAAACLQVQLEGAGGAAAWPARAPRPPTTWRRASLGRGAWRWHAGSRWSGGAVGIAVCAARRGGRSHSAWPSDPRVPLTPPRPPTRPTPAQCARLPSLLLRVHSTHAALGRPRHGGGTALLPRAGAVECGTSVVRFPMPGRLAGSARRPMKCGPAFTPRPAPPSGLASPRPARPCAHPAAGSSQAPPPVVAGWLRTWSHRSTARSATTPSRRSRFPGRVCTEMRAADWGGEFGSADTRASGANQVAPLRRRGPRNVARVACACPAAATRASCSLMAIRVVKARPHAGSR